eukprot:4517183-Prymnesium_polylepis.1
MARPYTASKWLSLIKPYLSRIEVRAVQWLAQGRLRPPKPLPGNTAMNPSDAALEHAVRAANAANDAAGMELDKAKADMAAAATALKEQMEAKARPGKKNPDPCRNASRDRPQLRVHAAGVLASEGGSGTRAGPGSGGGHGRRAS